MEIKTGEGKTLITAALAVIFALKSKKVHIHTSSPVLAAAALSDRQKLYDTFGLNVGLNSDIKSTGKADSDEQKRKIYRYSHIVIGAGAEFSFDWLRDRFYGKKIFGGCMDSTKASKGPGLVGIVDEVDVAAIDNFSVLSKLASDMAGFDLFLPVLAEIWDLIVGIREKIYWEEGRSYLVYGKLERPGKL